MKALSLFFLIVFGIVQAQFTATHAVTYQLEYVTGNALPKEQFILFIDKNNDQSYFLASSTYVKDTLKNKTVDMMIGLMSDFPEQVYRKKDTFTVVEDIVDVKLGYSQTAALQWKVLPNMGNFNNYKVQLAETNAYGRKWYAWFCRDIPINAGPYKFYNLPGLIMEMYDEQKKINFTLQRFKSTKRRVKMVKLDQFKVLAPEKFYQARYNQIVHDDNGVIFKDAEERRKWVASKEKFYFKIPMLDASYPVRR